MIKKLLGILMIGLVVIGSAGAYADDDTAQVRMRISGPIHDNRYFICLSNVGCLSILAGDNGRSFPMNPGDVGSIYTMDGGSMRIYHQSIPASCDVNVDGGQTLTVSGTIAPSGNGVTINNLHCSKS